MTRIIDERQSCAVCGLALALIPDGYGRDIWVHFDVRYDPFAAPIHAAKPEGGSR